jgi:flagellar basal-body rod protein FlgF
VHNGIHTAYSGLKAQMDALDTLANNLANVNTAGFKEQKTFLTALNQATGDSQASAFEKAVNSAVMTAGALNLTAGSVTETGKDLDVALVGNGFLTVETPAGERFTRNGNLITNSKSELCTAEGFPVLGEKGRIVLTSGKVAINQDGEVLVNGSRIDRLRIASFDNPGALTSEGSSLMAPADKGQAANVATGVSVRQGYLEQSNVNPVLSTVRMVEIMRNFETIQKSVHLIFNEIDAKAIEKLPR